MTPLAKQITALSHRHSTWQVFGDFLEFSALAISNAVDLRQREKREARYMHAIGRYEREELGAFPAMLAEVVTQLEAKPRDVLGALFGELELANKWVGQFFTPQDVADMMARMVFTEGVAPLIAEHGYIRVMEPAVGGGAMVIAACNALKEAGYNYQRQMHVTAVDVDERAVHMAYIQLALLHVPAVIVHGNSLTLEEHAHWYTPAHILDGWGWRLARRAPAPPIAPAPAAPVEERGQLALTFA